MQRCGVYKYALKVASCLALLVSTGCISGGGGYDTRPLTIEVADLFNQRAVSRTLGAGNWRGDWVFRRDRLDLVEKSLTNFKPDLLLFQGMLERSSGGSERDQAILSAGALSNYDWYSHQVEEYPDTQEFEVMAIATGPLNRFSPLNQPTKDIWLLGSGGFLQTALVEIDRDPLLVFNVKMPPLSDNGHYWYGFIEERIRERMREMKVCPKRVVIAGYMPADDTNQDFTGFINRTGMRDVAEGACQVQSRCYTATPVNDLFRVTEGDVTPARPDKIFVHQSALVYSSSRSLDESEATTRIAEQFGLTRFWPTQRFGWMTQVRFAKCSNGDLYTSPTSERPIQ
jgi:hypothetical protein